MRRTIASPTPGGMQQKIYIKKMTITRVKREHDANPRHSFRTVVENARVHQSESATPPTKLATCSRARASRILGISSDSRLHSAWSSAVDFISPYRQPVDADRARVAIFALQHTVNNRAKRIVEATKPQQKRIVATSFFREVAVLKSGQKKHRGLNVRL